MGAKGSHNVAIAVEACRSYHGLVGGEALCMAACEAFITYFRRVSRGFPEDEFRAACRNTEVVKSPTTRASVKKRGTRG